MRIQTLIACLLAFAALGYHIEQVGLASGIIDPLGTVGAQDEAVYASEAIHMALQGGWSTQVFLGRWELSKPPLLMWLTACVVKLAGLHRASLRFIPLLCGALAAALLFHIGAAARGAGAGIAGGLLVISNPLVHVLSRRNLTDIVVAAAACAAFAIVVRDPRLSARSTVWGAGAALSAAVLAKSVLGALPLFALLVAARCWKKAERPGWPRLILLSAIALLPTLLWFGYQLGVHPDYFLGEMRVIFGQSIGLRPQTSQESPFVFYTARIGLVDPVLTVLAFSGAWGLTRAVRERQPMAVLLSCWIAIFAVVLLAFQFRSASYVVPVVPALAAIAMLWSPLFARRSVRAGVLLLGCAFAIKTAAGRPPWGLSFAPSTAPTAAALSRYCELHRPTDLLIFDTVDQLYAAALPLARVRYVWVDPSGTFFRLEQHLHTLGILVSREEFLAGPGPYISRLRSAGLPNDDAFGTGIALHDAAELRLLFHANARSDFLLPQDRLPLLEPVALSHRLEIASDARVFLLARQPSQKYLPPSSWACQF